LALSQHFPRAAEYSVGKADVNKNADMFALAMADISITREPFWAQSKL